MCFHFQLYMAGIGIIRFENKKDETNYTIMEFNYVPTHHCNKYLKIIKQELKTLGKPGNIIIKNNSNSGTELSVIRILLFKLTTIETETLLEKLIHLAKAKEYLVKINKAVVTMQDIKITSVN